MTTTFNRRQLMAGAAGLAAFGISPLKALAAKPAAPVTINIIDVAGNLAETQLGFEAYAKAKPDWVSKITFSKAPAPELAGKIKAQQDAKQVDIDLVLTGTDGLAAGIEQNLWVQLLPDQASALPKLDDILLPGAIKMQALAKGQGVIVVYSPGGPLFEYMPDKVAKPPQTAEELLAWVKANPGRFMYARPANSGPGRAMLMGLPYILGDKDPKDPIKGWDKTWAYLKELDAGVEYYPTGTGVTMKELAEGSRDIIASMTGWDINPRAVGTVPKEAKIFGLKGFHFVTDAHYMCVPKGLPPEKLGVLLDIMAFMLQPAQQAYTYDKGFFYPGPAVKGVGLDLATPESQAVVRDFGRPEYDALIAATPLEIPLDATAMVAAFNKWDQDIGGAKLKK